jgi:hypothetical protein
MPLDVCPSSLQTRARAADTEIDTVAADLEWNLMLSFTRSRLGLALAAAIAALVVAAPVAFAGDPGEKAEKQKPSGPCEERTFARVFEPWNDRRLYTLAPGGDFETAADGWTLEGATVVADSSPFLLGPALGASSLELPAGATALSPPVCVERGFPSFRLVGRSVSAEPAVVKVQVVYADGRTKKTGRLKPAADWAVTRKLSLAQGRFRVRRGESALVQLRFAVTSGAARLDDVYVDPRFWR